MKKKKRKGAPNTWYIFLNYKKQLKPSSSFSEEAEIKKKGCFPTIQRTRVIEKYIRCVPLYLL